MAIRDSVVIGLLVLATMLTQGCGATQRTLAQDLAWERWTQCSTRHPGMTLQKMLKMPEGRGIRAEKNDLLLDPQHILPPPQTEMRLVDVHHCPALENPAVTAASNVASRSASAMTINAFLPPSSSCVRVRLAEHLT